MGSQGLNMAIILIVLTLIYYPHFNLPPAIKTMSCRDDPHHLVGRFRIALSTWRPGMTETGGSIGSGASFIFCFPVGAFLLYYIVSTRPRSQQRHGTADIMVTVPHLLLLSFLLLALFAPDARLGPNQTVGFLAIENWWFIRLIWQPWLCLVPKHQCSPGRHLLKRR
jgi:hypothetical protein